MSETDEPDFSGLAGGEEQAAADAVQKVVNWYTEQIAAERRSPLPDEERLAQLTAGGARHARTAVEPKT
ncbi:hypothetical protein [Streptomyces sp. bgisy027]|uniref:hypothetical protein n=1 Tax=Streptomyces sp. bgisy027 TaxID=3413770 RepID=UPI003D740DA7